MVCYLKYPHLNSAGNVTQLIKCGLKCGMLWTKAILKTTDGCEDSRLQGILFALAELNVAF